MAASKPTSWLSVQHHILQSTKSKLGTLAGGLGCLPLDHEAYDAQFAGSSSVPAHVEMMGFLGMGNNPMVGATVAVAVAVAQAM